MKAELPLGLGERALVLRSFPAPISLRTRRTLLRPWRDSDVAPYAEMNADAEVRRWFPTLLTPQQAVDEATRIRALLQERGWGLWALEVLEPANAEAPALGAVGFAGFVGLSVVPFSASFGPAVEIGWRLARPAWGRGYATEAARAALAFAFEVLQLPEVVSLTATGNSASRRVMQRLGLHHDAAHDFDHPRIEAGHALARHVLYRISAATFGHSAAQAAGTMNSIHPEERS